MDWMTTYRPPVTTTSQVWDPYYDESMWPGVSATNMLAPRGQMQMQVTPAQRLAQQAVQGFSPILSADIIEGVDDFHVHVDLPGVSPEDLNVTIANNVLHIEGERRKIHEEDTPYSHRLERSFGRVKRSLVIPEQADADSGLANFAHGVLTVKFGKKEGAISGRKLQIT